MGNAPFPQTSPTVREELEACCGQESGKYLEFEHGSELEILDINGFFNRSTNVSGYFKQYRGSCYAHTASSMYINTCHRIFSPINPIPTYGACLEIADYNHGCGGHVLTALKKLEDHFKMGILCRDSWDPPSIRDVCVLSVGISFTTSENGWNCIKNGSLVEKPLGSPSGWHASVVEQYSFNEGVHICKNSWGDQTARARFKLKLSALHCYYVTVAYFTARSISGKTSKDFSPRMLKFDTIVKNVPMKVAFMDTIGAKYSSEYLCKPNPASTVEEDKFIGYEVEPMIRLKLRVEE